MDDVVVKFQLGRCHATDVMCTLRRLYGASVPGDALLNHLMPGIPNAFNVDRLHLSIRT